MYQLDAIALSENVKARLTDFAADDSFVRDPQLSRICRTIWGGTPQNGGLISELWVEGAFPAKSTDDAQNGKTICLDELTEDGQFNAALRDQLDRRGAVPRQRALYLHQRDAILQAQQKGPNGETPSLVVTAGTGAGKTESFLLPLLNDLYAVTPKPCEGVECLILYPMNALVNDQVDRLYDWLKEQPGKPQCTLFHMTSETPEDRRTFQPPDDKPYNLCRMQTRQQARGLETHEGNKVEALNRQPPPRILITNYSMLEYMLCRPQDAPFFGTNLRAIVLDEAHLYTGTLAAEMTLLLRRLLARCGRRAEEVLQIATSATIGGGGQALVDFAAQLFSKPKSLVRLIEGQSDHVTFADMQPLAQPPTAQAICESAWLDKPTLTQGDEGRMTFVSNEETCRELRVPLQLLVAPECVEAAMQKAIGKPAIMLHEALIHSPLIAQAEAILWHEKRLSLPDFSARLFGETNEITRRAAMRVLQLGASARNEVNTYPILPHRLHLLARTTAGLSVCLNSDCTCSIEYKLDGIGRVLEGVQERCSDCGSAALTLVRCNHCGEWALGAQSDGQRVRPFPERWADGEIPPRLRVYQHKSVSTVTTFCISREGDVAAEGIRVWPTKQCANCGEDDNWVPFTTPDPYLLSTLTESVLAELPRNPSASNDWLPAHGRRLLAFSDSRTEAARLGPRLTRSHELQIFRAMLARELAKSQVDISVVAYLEGELTSLRLKLDNSATPASVKDLMRSQIAQYTNELAQIQSGGTVEQWGEKLKLSPLVRELMGDEFCDRDTPEKWDKQAQTQWEGNAKEAALSLKARINRELARPARKQVSLETLGLAEIVYPQLETVVPPTAQLVPHISSPEALAKLESHWTNLLALLCDDLRTRGCVTLGTDLEDDEYQFGAYLVGNWCALEQENVYTGLQRFVPVREGHQRYQFMKRVLCNCDLEDKQVVRDILKIAYGELLGNAGWNPTTQQPTGKPLLWLERDARELPRNVGGGGVEALRIRLPYVAARTPAQLYECATTSYLWTRQAAGCAPEAGCSNLNPVTQQQADASPRYGRLRRELIDSPIFAQGLWAEEHSAQLNPKENRRLQDLFKTGARNILSSTTTLELGIDIGGLNAVLMGNMPPGKANYLQRAGRAGRRADGSSLVVTFARSRPFDREVFLDFGKYLAANLRRPTINLERERIGRRHFHAWLLNEFFRIIYPPFIHVGAMRAFGDMGQFCGMVYPDRWNGAQKPTLSLFEPDWMQPQEAEWWNVEPASPGLDQQFLAYLVWLRKSQTHHQAASELFGDTAFYKQEWNVLVEETQQYFQDAVKEWKKDYGLLLQAWHDIPASQDQQRKANALRYQLQTMHDVTVIETLADKQFLPRYGFPIGVMQLKVIVPDEDKKGRVREEDQFRLSRPGLLALREYVPGTQLLAGGKLITSRGIMKHWTGAVTGDAFGLTGLYTTCQQGHSYYSISGSLLNCPICGEPAGDTPKDLLLPKHGFMSAASEPPRRGTDVERVGSAEQATVTFYTKGEQHEPYQRDVADITGLNAYYAEGGEILVYNEGDHHNGFAICTSCGYADSEREPKRGTDLPAGFDIHTPLYEANRKRRCRLNGALPPSLRNRTLAARETTDVLLLDISAKYGFKDKAKDDDLMLTLARALQAAGAKLLEIDEREIGVMTVATGEGGAYRGATLYDNVPGGAGHVLEMLNRSREWLETARELMYINEQHDQRCESACLDCLLNFSAQFDSSRMKRREAVQLLDNLLNDAMPNEGEELTLISEETGQEAEAQQAERQRRRQAKFQA